MRDLERNVEARGVARRARAEARWMTCVVGLLAATAWGAQGCYDLAGDCQLNLCGGSGTGTSSSSSSGAAPSCDPSENRGAVADTCGVFASSTADGAIADGTRASPFAALQDAVDAAMKGGTGRVYACAGTFDGAVQIPAGVTLYGGLACESGWSPGGQTTITADPGVVPIELLAGPAA